MRRIILAVLMILIPVSMAHAASNDCFVETNAPILTPKTSAPCSEDPQGNIRTSLGTLQSGENQTLNETYTSDSGLAVQYTSTGDKNVKSSAGELVGLLAVSGTSVTAVIYDDADGTCSSGVLSGTLTLTNGTFMKFPSRHSTGICITIGGTSPNVTVFYK